MRRRYLQNRLANLFTPYDGPCRRLSNRFLPGVTVAATYGVPWSVVDP